MHTLRVYASRVMRRGNSPKSWWIYSPLFHDIDIICVGIRWGKTSPAQQRGVRGAEPPAICICCIVHISFISSMVRTTTDVTDTSIVHVHAKRDNRKGLAWVVWPEFSCKRWCLSTPSVRKIQPCPGLPSHARCARHTAVVPSFTMAAAKLTCGFSGLIVLFADQNREHYFSLHHIVNLHYRTGAIHLICRCAEKRRAVWAFFAFLIDWASISNRRDTVNEAPSSASTTCRFS